MRSRTRTGNLCSAVPVQTCATKQGKKQMVKMFFFLKRAPEISPAEFHRYWSDHHGPLFASSAAARRYVVRYEQNHVASEDTGLSGMEFDGVSVMWFRSLDDVHAMRADTEYRDVVVRDGENFCDLTATKVMMTFNEEPFAITDADQ
jgi:uncharacterized protein (TIGR02118 family)